MNTDSKPLINIMQVWKHSKIFKNNAPKHFIPGTQYRNWKLLCQNVRKKYTGSKKNQCRKLSDRIQYPLMI